MSDRRTATRGRCFSQGSAAIVAILRAICRYHTTSETPCLGQACRIRLRPITCHARVRSRTVTCNARASGSKGDLFGDKAAALWEGGTYCTCLNQVSEKGGVTACPCARSLARPLARLLRFLLYRLLLRGQPVRIRTTPLRTIAPGAGLRSLAPALAPGEAPPSAARAGRPGDDAHGGWR